MDKAKVLYVIRELKGVNVSHSAFSGVITAIVTPFTSSGKLDLPAFKRLVVMQKRACVQGIMVSGTTGEGPTLTSTEREHLVLLALEERTPEFHVYVNTGSYNTISSIEESKKFSTLVTENKQKVDGIMCVVPYYNKPTQKGLFEHFKAIFTSIPNTPCCIYNVPGRTITEILPETFYDILRVCPNLVAIKEASGNLKTMVELRKTLDTKFKNQNVHILSGDDPSFPLALLCGASGVISISANIIPGVMIKYLEHAKKNDLIKLRELHIATQALHIAFASAAPNPIPIKWALSHLGICENNLRLPLTPLEGKEIDTIMHVMNEAEQLGIKFFT